jgi:hypothetical protein
MKTHFELPINYENNLIKVNVQIISNQLPHIKYVVFTNDEEINKNLMSNVKQFYFKISSNLNENNTLEIKNNVSYDYINNENIVTDVIFEFSVWNALFNLNI